MLRAIIFDFNGVIVDDERLHLRAFQDALAGVGVSLTSRDYFARYLGLDDRSVFRAVLAEGGREPESRQLERLLELKSDRYDELIRDELVLFPGAADFVRRAAAQFPLALASGALRREIEAILRRSGLVDVFAAIVSADDSPESKPNPEPFSLALQALNRTRPGDPIEPGECVVVEDSPWGIDAAHAAGMKCMAVTHTYPAGKLAPADRIVDGLVGLDPDALGNLCDAPGLR